MSRYFARVTVWLALVFFLNAQEASAQSGIIAGTVRNEGRSALPGALVELAGSGPNRQTRTDSQGEYRFAAVPPGPHELVLTLVNFAPSRESIIVPASGTLQVDLTLQLALNADVTVTEKATFVNLADADTPAQSLLGIAQAASQGAITARQLERRPIMRAGEVLETVPGLVISQHSGEGKANQYYLRGFNLDHGTDFATTVAGMPVNMPTHGHGHGYSDLNFLIPELVTGVQFSKGPYFAEQGDFATAGAVNINYANRLARPLARVTAGGQGFARALFAASPALAGGQLLSAIEIGRNDGPWERPDDFRKVNGLLRFSRGDTLNGFSVTAMGYRATWYSTDQIPRRAIDQGTVGRLGTLDETGGGEASRYSGSVEWQRTQNNASTRLIAYGIAADLDLFSNFTFFLHDAQRGDQFRQTDTRLIAGGKVSHRRVGRWGGRAVQNTVGVQVRHDSIGDVGLYRTEKRQLLGSIRQDRVQQTSAAVYIQNELQWTSWLRTLNGLRLDGYRFRVAAGERAGEGTQHAERVSPKAGAVLGPWARTELYANAGFGFHSNDARGAITTSELAVAVPAGGITPLAQAGGAEAGLRSIPIPGLQTTLTLWTLRLESELIFVGDMGTTEPARGSRRSGLEWSTYYAPTSWLTLDADITISRARFADANPAGAFVPGAVETVVAAGATVDDLRKMFGSIRWRYFGPRPLTEDNSVRSSATALASLEGGYKVSNAVRLALGVFNVLNAKQSDVDYFYTSRLPGEPAGGVEDVHLHPTLPRTARISLLIGF